MTGGGWKVAGGTAAGAAVAVGDAADCAGAGGAATAEPLRPEPLRAEPPRPGLSTPPRPGLSTPPRPGRACAMPAHRRRPCPGAWADVAADPAGADPPADVPAAVADTADTGSAAGGPAARVTARRVRPVVLRPPGGRAALRARRLGRGRRRLLRPSIGPVARLRPLLPEARCRRRPAARRRCSYASRISASVPITAVLTVVQLGFEHPGILPSGSRARGSAKNPPLRAGAGRTRSLGGCPSRGRPTLPGALSLSVPVPRLAHAPRLPRQPLRRVAPAPAWSPAVVTTAQEQPRGEVRPGCRRVVRQVSCAEQPFEVSHTRRSARLRHAGLSPW